jgi:hypothetical protein
MRIDGVIAICWAVVVLCCGSAQAQDQDRDRENNSVDGVDASVHATVDGQPQKPQAAVGSTKQPATFSSWSLQRVKHAPTTLFPTGQSTKSDAALAGGKNPSTFGGVSHQPANQSPASIFRPSRVVPVAPTPATDGNSSKRTGQPILFDRFAVSYAYVNSTALPVLKIPVPPTSAVSETQGFSIPFARQQSGLRGTSAFPRAASSSNQDRTKTKPSKSQARKSAASLDFSATKKH